MWHIETILDYWSMPVSRIIPQWALCVLILVNLCFSKRRFSYALCSCQSEITKYYDS